MTLSAVI